MRYWSFLNFGRKPLFMSAICLRIGIVGFWDSGIMDVKIGNTIFFSYPIIPEFHYSNILAGLKQTSQWSKILFRERK